MKISKETAFSQNLIPNKKTTVTEVTTSFMMFQEDVDLQHLFVKSILFPHSELQSKSRKTKDQIVKLSYPTLFCTFLVWLFTVFDIALNKFEAAAEDDRSKGC